MRRSFVWGLLAAGLAVAAPFGAAQAQSFPARPVTLIVPWPAGGSTDVGMRALASATERHLGQSIVVENRPGGSGTLAPGQMAATAKPDGYTVAQIPITVFRFPFMQKTSFDPGTDFTYVIGVSGYTFGVVVNDDAPWRTFEAMIADAKANPGKINYGSPGTGTSLHIAMEQIARRQGIQWTHIPFKGNSEAMNALLGHHIDAVADSSGWAQLVNAGRFRLLVTWGVARTKNWQMCRPCARSASTWCRTRRSASPAQRAWIRRSCRCCTTRSRRGWRSHPTSRRWPSSTRSSSI
jgi:tripartite-type tricarboxylate transporter receptor subunit TctC